MRVKKRFLSLFLSVAMVLSITPVFATLSSQYDTELEGKTILEDVTNDEDIPMMSLVYLKKDESGNFVPDVIPSEGLQENDVFFVGLKVTNFKKYVAMKNYGLDSMTVSVVYDSNYVEPMFETSSGEVYGDDSKYATNIQESIAKDADSFINKKAMNAAGRREVAIYNDITAKLVNYSSDVTGGVIPSQQQTALQIGISTNPSGLQNGADIVKGAIDTEYLAILSFITYTPPTTPTKVLAISTQAADMSISMASSPATQLGYNNESIPWNKFLRLDNSGGNIFPAEYTLEYYNDNTQATKVYTETISETSLQAAKMSEAQAEAEKVKPNESDYFMGWKDAAGDKFEGDISALLPDDPATPIKIYADWKTGYPVNFYAEKEDIGDDAKKLETKYVKPDGSSTLGAINLPDNPTKTDYGFNKWLCEDDSDFKADTTVIPEGGLNVYADWTEMLTINYDTNGSSDTIEKSTDAPDATYTLPTDPTRNGYTFVGWNTKKNGAGDYISVTSTTTYQDISNMLDTTKTMYAQWADVKDPTTDPDKIKNEPEQPADPADNGVRVKFDSNAGNDTTVVDAKPLYKYPKIDDTIPGDNMPDVPTRDHYVCTSWNTLPSGGGTSFATDGDLTITSNMLAEGSNEVVLYAQWDVNPEDPIADQNKVTVKFDTNTTDTGATPANPNTREVWLGDTLVNLPEPPVNGTFVFGGWNTAVDGSGTSVDATTPITENIVTVGTEGKEVTLYAQWSKLINLKMEYQDGGGQKADPVYDGTPKIPKIIEIWEADESGQDLRQITDPTEIQYYKDNITIKYQLLDENDQPVGNSTDSPTNAGEYEYDVTLTTELTGKNIDVKSVGPDNHKINPMSVDFTISNQQARYAGTAGAAPATITVTTTNIPSDFIEADHVKVTYKQLALPDGDRVIESGKFGTFSVENPAATDFNSTDRIGKYVIELSITNKNYEVGQITPNDATYPKIDDNVNIYYPSADAKNAIKYEVIPNDPKATGLAVTKEGEDRATQALTLTDSDYETTKAFTSDDEATTDEAKKNHYWVTVDKDTDAVDIYVDAETYYTVKINGDSEDTLTNGTAKDTVSNLKKTIETDENGVITKTDVDNVIPIKVESAGSDPKEYTIHVRRLADAQATDLKFTEKDNPDNIFGLKDNTYETDKEFKPGDTEYWVRVPKDKDTVDVLVSALGQGDKKITINGTQVTPDANGVAKANITDLKQAVEKNDDGTLKRDENNQVIVNAPKDITVVIGEGADAKTYTIHVQRLGEGGIDLNPGNSPYGLIERMRNNGWTRAQINAVKAQLFEHETTPTTARYKFQNKINVVVNTETGETQEMDAMPNGALAGLFYQPQAWGTVLDEASYDPEYNMDMNDNALFIYQKQPFKDPGFTAYDESGQVIDITDTDVTVTRVVKDVQRMKVIDLLDLDTEKSGDVTLETNETDGLVHNLTHFVKGESKLIRPDIYNLEYTISRPDKEDIKITRKIILLARRGDVNLDDDITSNDDTIVRKDYQSIEKAVPSGLVPRIANLYKYRIVDVNLDADITSNDETLIRKDYQAIEKIVTECYNLNYDN